MSSRNEGCEYEEKNDADDVLRQKITPYGACGVEDQSQLKKRQSALSVHACVLDWGWM